MLKRVKVVPLAFESLGVRSMCTLVETPDVKVLLDAGVSLGPRRFGLPPHPREYEALMDGRRRILEAAEDVDIVTVSHYHFDHQTPSYTDWAFNWCSESIAERIYSGKIVFMKSYRSSINFSQRRRGWMFVQTSGRKAERLVVCDGRSFRFGETVLSFSSPVFHGEESSDLGWVVMTVIDYGGSERVLFTSDVQGPMCSDTLEIILGLKPDLIILGGPPIYLSGMVEQGRIEDAFRNIREIAMHTPTVILEHHLLRDRGWRLKVQPVLDEASKRGHRVLTAAEYLGQDNRFLEAYRDDLYREEPPPKDFIRWSRIPVQRRKLIQPPI